MSASGPLHRESPPWPPRTDPNEPACALWQRERGCLSVPDGGAPAEEMLTEHDICLAVHALGSVLRERCTADCAARSCQACLPLGALEQLLRLLDEDGIRRSLGVDEDGTPRVLPSLNDLVRRAVRTRDPEVQDVLCARLTSVLARICRNRLASPDSPDAASYV